MSDDFETQQTNEEKQQVEEMVCITGLKCRMSARLAKVRASGTQDFNIFRNNINEQTGR